MKRRVFAAIISVCMVLSLGAINALADDIWTEVDSVEELTNAMIEIIYDAPIEELTVGLEGEEAHE